tara:strand:+ start:1933 stop:3141 length:1209 start_codon:yes stop_codon:yes gene_type:complete
MSVMGFLGGLSEGIYEGIEKEEERINLLADKAYDQFTQDLRADKAKREAARKAAEGYMFRLKEAGYDIATSAHIARYGEDAVKSAETKAAQYGDVYDINTLYNVAPDPSTKDFKQGQWLDLIVGESTVKASDYMGRYGGAADYKSLFGPSARDVFNDRVKGLDVSEAIPTGQFGTMTPKRLTKKETKTYNSFEAILTDLAIQKSDPSITPEKKESLETRFKEVLTAKRNYDAELEAQGKASVDFSKQSRKSIVDSYVASALPNIAQSIDGKLQIAFDGDDPNYLTGMNSAIQNLKNDFTSLNDEMMNNSIKSLENNFIVYKTGYANKQILMSTTEGKSDKSKFYPQTDGKIPSYEELVQNISAKKYPAGAVIVYKDENNVQKLAIWSGASLMGATAQYFIPK